MNRTAEDNRVAIYARYSSDKQNDASIEDQVRLCREFAEKEGWTVVEVYSDHAISGASMMRPGIQTLIQGAMSGKYNIIVSEALDRISRNQADIASIFERFQFLGLRLMTLSEGEVNSLHIGLKGTMNALFLKDLKDKVKRGQRGSIEKGKSAGGLPYGYKVVRQFDERGEMIRGDREIDPDQARIINRILTEYAEGRSPRAIAIQLNEEGVPSPRGNGWNPSAINGNRRRGIGILNNEIYIGQYVWNRQQFIKDPDTGKRVPRFNPEDEWIRAEAPELRIVDQELWDRVKARQRAMPGKDQGFWKAQRPKYLLSGLVKCGVCGSGCSKKNHERYSCTAAREKRLGCNNHLSIKQDVLEQAVINALQSHLMDPKLCEVFCKEYAAHLNKIRMERNAQLAGHQAEFERLEKRRKVMVDCMLDGMPAAGFKDEMIALLARKEELEKILNETDVEQVLIHPNMAYRYHQEVKDLVESLNDEKRRNEASELLRKLVEKIELVPDETGKELTVNLHGDLAGILAIARKNQPAGEDLDLGMVKLVAEEGLEPPTRGL